MRLQKVYYKVFALKDGTVFYVSVSRKPRQTRHGPRVQIDEEGVCTWYVETDCPEGATDWAKGTWHTAIATSLNVKRIVRQQIQPRFDQIEKDVLALRAQIGDLEKKIDRLISLAEK